MCGHWQNSMGNELDPLLWNWGHWAKVSRFYGAPSLKAPHINSYSSPQGKGNPTGWGDYNPGILPPIRQHFDRHSAEIVEHQVCQLAPRCQVFLKFHYIYKADPRAICRKLKLKFSEYEQFHDGAKLSLKNRLTRFTTLLSFESTAKSESESLNVRHLVSPATQLLLD